MGVNTRNSIVTNGLVLQLDAANSKSYVSGSTIWTDLSGQRNSGSLSSTGYGADFGGNIVFRNSTATTTNNNSSLTFGSGDFSVECWFNTNGASQTTGAGLIGVNAAASANNWVFSFPAGTGLSYFYNASGNIDTTYNANTPGWTHLLLTRIGVTTRIYINGVFKASTNAATSTFSDNVGFRLGQNRAGTAAYSGSISIVRAYSRGLSAGEVSQNYNALKARFNLS
jgi:hypothetical protein